MHGMMEHVTMAWKILCMHPLYKNLMHVTEKLKQYLLEYDVARDNCSSM